MARDPRSHDEHEPTAPPPALSSAVLALLDAERHAPGPSPEAMARVAQRLSRSTAVATATQGAKASWWKLGLGSSAVVAAAWIGVASLSPEPVTPAAVVANAGAPSRAPLAPTPAPPVVPETASHEAVSAPAAFVNAVEVALVPAPVVEPRSDERDDAPSAPRRAIATLVAAAAVEPTPVEPAPVEPAPNYVAAPDVSVVARSVPPERVLVLAARDALVKAHDPKAALARIAEASRAYPRGVLREELERLKFQAYFAAGRLDDARRAATRFLARYPGSVHRSAAEAILAQ